MDVVYNVKDVQLHCSVIAHSVCHKDWRHTINTFILSHTIVYDKCLNYQIGEFLGWGVWCWRIGNKLEVSCAKG